MTQTKEIDYLIIGGGTFGLSTALDLLRRGKTNVTIVDPYSVPSEISAGNDMNKIVQTTSDDDFYSSLALEALNMWKNDPVFKPAFHETGIVYAGTGKEAKESIDYRYRYLLGRKDNVVKLTELNEFAKYVPLNESSDGRFKDWYGYLQRENCGWTYAKLALENCAAECIKLGVEFIIDSAEQFIITSTGDCAGVITRKGTELRASKTILCAGANSFKFLNFENQLLAKCWTLAHIKLTDEEAAKLKDMPVILNLDGGFVFEPDQNNEIKFCNEFPGYINMEQGNSIPIIKNAIPEEAEIQMRNFLRLVFPKFAERDFSMCKICWCTDTPDRHFLICEHPSYKGLILGTGDSGQGFKYMPNIGKYIGRVATDGDKALDTEKRNLWRWRPETGKTRDIMALQHREGGSNKIKDLQEITKWSDGTC